MKVYVVLKYEDDRPEIQEVFLRLSRAEQYIKSLNNCEYYIEEYKVTI